MSIILSLDTEDISLATAGGKGKNLARLVRAGFPVPPGFVITTCAYDTFVAANALADFVLETVRNTSPDDTQALESASAAIRARFVARQLPADLAGALVDAYAVMGRPPVAVRSSATAEDLPGMSFAGQQDTYLQVVGEDALRKAVIDCWSSLWTARAVGYRARNGIPHENVSLAVVVQKMISSETSGRPWAAIVAELMVPLSSSETRMATMPSTSPASWVKISSKLVTLGWEEAGKWGEVRNSS